MIRCVSTHALSSCDVGNTVEGFINHENTRVSDVFTYTETTEEDISGSLTVTRYSVKMRPRPTPTATHSPL